MSFSLLEKLNGNGRGLLRKWLDGLIRMPRVAWYPSAYSDLRDLSFLSAGYARANHPSRRDAPPPDIFIHTDIVNPWGASFSPGKVLHDDGRTTVTVKGSEELPRLDLPTDPGIIPSPRQTGSSGRVFYLELEVQSHLLGTFQARVIYAFVENAAFCSKTLLPSGAVVSHLIHVRHGGGCGGGGRASGAWLLGVLDALGCEVFITDGHLEEQEGDRRALAAYPVLWGQSPGNRLVKYREIPSRSWSGHGDVTWYRLRRPRPEKFVPFEFNRPLLLDFLPPCNGFPKAASVGY